MQKQVHLHKYRLTIYANEVVDFWFIYLIDNRTRSYTKPLYNVAKNWF